MLQSDGFGPAYRDLARREPVFARLITVYGRPDPFEWHDGGRTGSSQFAAMLLHIVGQQISAVAAFAIYDRISAATGGILASAGVLGLGQDRLRACGLSAARARYALALAEACRPAAGSARVPSRAMTEEQASKVLKAAAARPRVSSRSVRTSTRRPTRPPGPASWPSMPVPYRPRLRLAYARALSRR
jgi:DNA-3-methyladenine glycosylase II